jgi:DNA-binding transcriptional LysR family regulator
MVTAPLLKRVRTEAPTARIAQRSVVGARALELLERGEIDLAIGTFAALPQGFLSELVLRQKFKVVARKGHPCLQRGLKLERYLSLDHILVSFRAGFVGRVDEVLQSRGLQRRVVASVPMFLAALAIVAESDLVATLPEAIAAQQAARFGLSVHRCPVDVEPFDILAVRHARTRTDAGIDWLFSLMRHQRT